MILRLRTIFDSRDADAVVVRLRRLDPSARARWGRMNAHQAVCHLQDSLRATLGERRPAPRPMTWRRRVTRFIGFTLPLRWPHGIRTSAEIDALRDGTPPGVFERDVAELERLLAAIRATRGTGLPPHYAWGAMGPGEMGRYVFRHFDHHLRQFGV